MRWVRTLRNDDRGAVLINVLLLVAVLSILIMAVLMMTLAPTQSFQTTLYDTQALYNAQAGIQVAEYRIDKGHGKYFTSSEKNKLLAFKMESAIFRVSVSPESQGYLITSTGVSGDRTVLLEQFVSSINGNKK